MENAQTDNSAACGQSRSTVGLGGWFDRLTDWLWPMCPTGQHRIKMGLVTNINGNQFCWHPDCMSANLADCKTHKHHFEPDFSYAGKLFERCSCGAHRIYGEPPNDADSRRASARSAGVQSCTTGARDGS